MALACIPLLGLFILLRQYYIASSRELKRLEAIAKTPIFATFTGSLSGLETIRAFDGTGLRQQGFMRKLDEYGRAWYAWLLVNRWIGFRLDMISALVLLLTAVGSVLLREHYPDTIDPGMNLTNSAA